MSKILDCTHRHAGCGFSATAETEEEVVQTVAAHVKNEHDVAITTGLVAELRSDVRDGQGRQDGSTAP